MAVLKIAYPFMISRGIGDLLLFGSQALSAYMSSSLRSKDLDLVSSQMGPGHLDALEQHLAQTGLETRSSTVQSRPLPKGRMITYSVELRLEGKPFFIEIFDKVLDGQNPSVLTPYAQHVHKWDLDLWTPSPNATVALRLCFRPPEGISPLNARRLNNFIQQNRRKIDFQEIKKIIDEWGMEETVKANLGALYNNHRTGLSELSESELEKLGARIFPGRKVARLASEGRGR